MTETEVRICPLGPPQPKPAGHKGAWVRYAWCGECGHVRKNTKDCPMIEAQESRGDQ